MGLKIEGAFIKAFTHKVGAKKNTLTIVIPLTPAIAQELKVKSVVYNTENMPKPELIEVKLDVKKSLPYALRLEVVSVKDVLNVQCEDAKDWIARQKGSLKKGKTSRLLIEFKAIFTGSGIGVFEWIEKYGQAQGNLTIDSCAPQQQELTGDEPEKKARGKAAASGEAVQ